jgi:hypothetical protein
MRPSPTAAPRHLPPLFAAMHTYVMDGQSVNSPIPLFDRLSPLLYRNGPLLQSVSQQASQVLLGYRVTPYIVKSDALVFWVWSSTLTGPLTPVSAENSNSSRLLFRHLHFGATAAPELAKFTALSH